jgi:hypothetical protein
MKPVDQVVACVVDYGTFISLADKLGETYSKVFYYSPMEGEYRDARDCVIGDGIPNIDRIDEFMDPAVFDQTDLFIFPDIGWGGTQRYLRQEGKAVWGSMGADDLEQYRTRFNELIESLGMPMVATQTVKGLTNLALVLKDCENKWIKINRFRQNMETWHHHNWVHSERKLEELAHEFGGIKELITFTLQDDIETDVEVGYDGWCIDGKYPTRCFQGYEKKNELYLGALTEYGDLPEAIQYVNEKMAPTLKAYGYRNFIATEIRCKDDEYYFIDPTMRMPGQTGEQALESCKNLAEVIWKGANGEVVDPDYCCTFAAEATMHYTDGDDQWKTVEIPSKIRPMCKLVHYCIVDGVYHFPPGANDEIGVVMGLGDTIEAAIDDLKENFSELKQEPLKINDTGFIELLEAIHEAEKSGVEFTSEKVPEPASLV